MASQASARSADTRFTFTFEAADTKTMAMKSGSGITIALDLEGTLISNHVSQIPRPGLHEFLNGCRALFKNVVMFTSVPETRFREIALQLVSDGTAPPWFAELEVIAWSGKHKDLSLLPGPALLLDDYEGYVKPDQVQYWVPIDCYASPYPEEDEALEAVMSRLPQLIKDLRVAEQLIDEIDTPGSAVDYLPECGRRIGAG